MAFRALEIEGRFSGPPDASVEYDGKTYAAREGEPVAVTLLAHGVRVLGRSPKYHRSRGLLCGRGSCGACLARLDGMPTQRLCLAPAGSHSVVAAQNTLGGAEHDLLAAIDWVFPGGLDHHHLMTRSTALNRFAVGVAHQLAGLGTLPEISGNGAESVVDERRVTAVVVGAGPAGGAAAAALRERGVGVLTLDARAVDGEGVLGEAQVLGRYDERELLVSRRGRLMRLTAEAIIIATGAHEQLPSCPGNDLPGLFLRRAAELALAHGVLPGRRVVLAVAERADESTRAAAEKLGRELRAAGAALAAVLGPVGGPRGGAGRGATCLSAIEGGRVVRAVRVAPAGERIACDAVVWCARPAPAYELARQMGLEARYAPELEGFVPVCAADGASDRPGVFIAGEAAGIDAAGAAAHGRRVGLSVATYVTRVTTAEVR